MHIESFQSCPTLWNFMDCSPSGSSFHSILLASILGWVPCLPLGDLHHRGNKSVSLTFPALAGGFFTTSTTWKPRNQSTTRNLRFFLRQKKTDWNILYFMYFVKNRVLLSIIVCFWHQKWKLRKLQWFDTQIKLSIEFWDY